MDNEFWDKVREEYNSLCNIYAEAVILGADQNFLKSMSENLDDLEEILELMASAEYEIEVDKMCHDIEQKNKQEGL